MLASAFLSLALPLPAGAWENPFQSPSKREGIPVLMYHIVSPPPEGADTDCFTHASKGADAGSCVRPAGPPAHCPPLFGGAPDTHMTVSLDEFKLQMERLKAGGWRTLTLEEFFDSGYSGSPKEVVITFDDGYEDNFSEAYPVLRRMGLRANLFMVSDNVDCPGRLSAAQLRQMDGGGSGAFRVYAHSKTHPRLSLLPPEKQAVELKVSKLALESLLGHPVSFLAYPYGNYSSETESIAAQEGYRAAFTTRPGIASSEGDAYALPRYGISDMRSFESALGSKGK